jgi:hypothetical protein
MPIRILLLIKAILIRPFMAFVTLFASIAIDPSWLHSEPPQPLNFDSNTVPDPTFHSDADPDHRLQATYRYIINEALYHSGRYRTKWHLHSY